MSNFEYDCVYYWHYNRWKKAILVAKWLGGKNSLDELKKSIEKIGYSAVFGNSAIGRPVGPPK
jgi:hypothetical protein